MLMIEHSAPYVAFFIEHSRKIETQKIHFLKLSLTHLRWPIYDADWKGHCKLSWHEVTPSCQIIYKSTTFDPFTTTKEVVIQASTYSRALNWIRWSKRRYQLTSSLYTKWNILGSKTSIRSSLMLCCPNMVIDLSTSWKMAHLQSRLSFLRNSAKQVF